MEFQNYSTALPTTCKEKFECSLPLEKNYTRMRPFLLPLSEKVSWTAFFSLMVICAIVGNLMVIWVIAAHRRMRTVTNYFLLNLSISDLTMAIFNIIFNFIYMIDSHWPFGTVYCVINNFIASLTVCTSVFSIMAISIDRYFATMKIRGAKKMTKIISCAVIAGIWIGSALLALPAVLYSRVNSIKYQNGQRDVCLMQWPDGPEGKSNMDYVYNIAFWQLTYVLPVISMGLTYGVIAKELWGIHIAERSSQRNIDIIQDKRKVIRMLIVMVLAFSLCWLPYHIFFIYKHHDTSILTKNYIQHVYLAIYWLAMSNALINPIIYYWMNARFREYFKIVICSICRIRCRAFHERARYPPQHFHAHRRDSRI